MATLNLNKKKFLSEENVAQIVKIGINFGERLNSIESEIIADYDNTKTYLKGESCYHNNYIYRCKATATGDWDFSRWELIGDEITELTKDDIKDMLGLSDEELETLSKIILDSEVRLDKTYSSSKIYTDIQNAIDTAKAYTLTELGKISGASYKVVTATSDMTDEKVIYLLQNGSNYDMYIVDSGTPVKIGDTTIDLSDYYTKTEIDNDFLKKTDADGKYATIEGLNNHTNDTDIHTSVLEKASYALKEKITDTINENSTSEDIASAKAVYNATVDKNIKTYCLFSQLGLSSGCSVSDIFNAMPIGSIGRFDYNGSTITDMPSINGGVLLIDKCNAYRFSIEFKESAYGSVANNNMWIGQLQGSDGSGITWTKVCTSKVNNVEQTSIEFDETVLGVTISLNRSFYEVINGICYGTIELIVNAPSDDISYGYAAINTTNLPTIGFSTKATLNVVEANSSISVVLDKTTTNIKLHGNILAKEGTYIIEGSFSYPVAES